MKSIEWFQGTEDKKGNFESLKIKENLEMQERKHGVNRLLKAIEQSIDDNNIHTLARILNYHEPQLKEDIEAIKFVEVLNKDDIENEK